jgi:hypothetical protein
MGTTRFDSSLDLEDGCCTRVPATAGQACIVPYPVAIIGSSNTRLQSPLFRPRTMSQTHPSASSSSSSNFQSVLNAAIDAYEKKTKSKLLTHPLAAQLQSCDLPIAILSVLQGLVQQFHRRRSSDERLTNWLTPTVNVLYTFSSTVGQGIGLVSLSSLFS